MEIVNNRNFNNNSDFVYISGNEVYDKIISLSINEFINNGCIGGVAYGIAIKEGLKRNVIEMIDNKRMIIDKELSYEDLNSILNKYYEDRFNYVRNGSYKMIELIPGSVSSSKYQIDGDILKIYLSLKSNNEFEKDELCFIEILIDMIFAGEKISHKSRVDGSIMGFHLVGENSDFSIKLTDMANYNKVFYSLVNSHNIEVNENKYRKLKKEEKNKNE